MKNLLISITTSILVFFAVGNAVASEVFESEEKYEQAYEVYVQNLDSEVDGIVVSSMMNLVEMVRTTGNFDHDLISKLRELVRQDDSVEVTYNAYLAILALNYPNVMDQIEPEIQHHSDYFNLLTERFTREFTDDAPYYTTEVQESE